MIPKEIIIMFSDGSRVTVENTYHVNAVEMVGQLAPYQGANVVMVGIKLIYR